MAGHHSTSTYLIILNLPTEGAPAGHFQWLSTFSHIKSIFILMLFKDCYTWNRPFFLIIVLTPFLHLNSVWSGHSLLGFKFWALVCVCSVPGHAYSSTHQNPTHCLMFMLRFCLLVEIFPDDPVFFDFSLHSLKHL